MQRSFSAVAVAAAFACAAALAGFGALLPGYSHLVHPVGLPGATGMPRATAFNLLALVLPGVLAAVVAIGWRGRLGDAPWRTRVGAQALMLSALAFVAQGLLPLDPADLDAGASRLHAAAWTVWWLAFGVAGVMLATGLPAGPRKAAARSVALAAAIALPLALAGPWLLPAGLCQRLAFALWFVALWRVSRGQP